MFGWFRKQKAVQDLGAPIVVVSGLPRSGTSMAMKMLEKGGLPTVQDGVRQADDDNPRGYYEDERVMRLAESLDRSWLRAARGKAIKIISYLLKELPRSNRYQVIFMRRNLDEVLRSQAKMLENRGEKNPAPDDEMRKTYEDHLRQVDELCARHGTMERLDVDYARMVEDPRREAQRIADFLGGHLDVNAMATVADKSLYRNRVSP